MLASALVLVLRAVISRPTRAALLGAWNDDDCWPWRQDNPRALLVVHSSHMDSLLLLSGLHRAGWEVGLVANVGAPYCGWRGCGFRDRRSSSSIVRFVRLWKGTDPREAVLAAVGLFRPALVMADSELAAQLMHDAGQLASERADAGNASMREVSARLRCSLPRLVSASKKIASKFSRMQLARRAGVRVPRSSRRVGASDVNSTDADPHLRELPLVVKKPKGMGGVGTRICRTRAELRRALLEMCTRSACMVERYVAGYTVHFSGAVLDGELLAGYAYLLYASTREEGAAYAIRTVNVPDAAAQFRRLAARLGLTGVAGVDFRVDERSGKATAIDPNLRPNAYAGLSGEVLATPTGLFDALRDALRQGRGGVRERARSAPPTEVTASRVIAKLQVSGGGLPVFDHRHRDSMPYVMPAGLALWGCADVHVPVAWELPSVLEALGADAAGEAVFDLSSAPCTLHFTDPALLAGTRRWYHALLPSWLLPSWLQRRRPPPTVSLHQGCPQCQHACQRRQQPQPASRVPSPGGAGAGASMMGVSSRGGWGLDAQRRETLLAAKLASSDARAAWFAQHVCAAVNTTTAPSSTVTTAYRNRQHGP